MTVLTSRRALRASGSQLRGVSREYQEGLITHIRCPTTASTRSSSSKPFLILPSAPPRNSTPCGQTTAIRPEDFTEATMCCTKARSP